MSDRELLEAAAKAAGWPETKVDDRGWFYICSYQGQPIEWELWDPLTNNGDAFALAMHLGMRVSLREVWADGGAVHEIGTEDDYMEATRRAIVRAAAALAP